MTALESVSGAGVQEIVRHCGNVSSNDVHGECLPRVSAASTYRIRWVSPMQSSCASVSAFESSSRIIFNFWILLMLSSPLHRPDLIEGFSYMVVQEAVLYLVYQGRFAF